MFIHIYGWLKVAGIIVDFGKKSTRRKHPSTEKKYIFSKKSTHFAKKSTFGVGKKHLVNIISLTKSNKKVLKIKLFSLFFICVIVSQGNVPHTM